MNITAVLQQAEADLNAQNPERAHARLLEALDQLPTRCSRLEIGLAITLRAQGQFDAAAKILEQVVAHEPLNPVARTYLGMIWLTQGRLREGWQAYRSRWQMPHWSQQPLWPINTAWDGALKPNLKLLLWSEQGYGDCIQFMRYAPWLKTQGILPTLHIPAPLQRLATLNWPDIPLLKETSPQSDCPARFHTHLPLMDIPAVWQGPLLAVPDKIPYLHIQPTDRISYPQHDKPRIGIAWAGRSTHPDNAYRSMSAEHILPLIRLPNIHWHSLQKEQDGPTPQGLIQSLAHAQDFYDTARVIESLDLIITVDTSIAHLAGALGKPTWVMLPFFPDFRWMLEREDSPWYPSLRLFRQKKRGDWTEVIQRIQHQLRTLAP